MILFLFASALFLPIPVGDTHRVESPAPFESMALSWSAPAEVNVRVRVSDDGSSWSEWQAVSLDHDSSDPSAGRYVTAIAHFGAAKKHLQIETSAPVQRMTATMFPPHPPRRRIVPFSISVGGLLVRSRSDWGCPDGQDAKDWKPAYTTVTHAVVHHTAGSNSVANWEAEMRSIWNLHTFTNGWGDIGYNYLIDPNGVIYEGRAGGFGAIGAHFSCRNTNTVGVAMLGTYSNVIPTPAALDSLKRLLAEIVTRHHIDPTAFAIHVPSQLNVPTIMTHRDGNTSPLTCTRTECPGDALYAMMPAIRSDVAATKVTPAPRRRAVGK